MWFLKTLISLRHEDNKHPTVSYPSDFVNSDMQKKQVLIGIDMEEDLRTWFEQSITNLTNLEVIICGADIKEWKPYQDTVEFLITWNPDEEFIEGTRQLEGLMIPGSGVSTRIPPLKTILQSKNIKLMNSHGNAYATAQGAISILFALLNKVVTHHKWMEQGRWRLGDEEGATFMLHNCTVGLLGYGAIMQHVHRFLKPFDVNFAVCRTDANKNVDGVATYATADLHAFLKATDILIIGVPLLPETEGMIGPAELEALGQDSFLVNIARGKVIDEQALYEALDQGKIAGAAIDVWYNYKPEPDEEGRLFPYAYPFYKLDNVVLSPHRAASPQMDHRRFSDVLENMIRYNEGRELLNLVDLDKGY